MATKHESALRRKAKRRGVELVRSRIKDAGCVQFGKWSIVEVGSDDVFAGLKGGEPVWLDATPGNCHRTAWLDASEVDRLLDETFTANPKRGLPSPEIVAAARAAADRPKNISVALSAGYSVKRSAVMVEADCWPERPRSGDPGRSEQPEPGAGAACSTLAAMKPADAAEVLANGLDVSVLHAWVRLSASEAGEGPALIETVHGADSDALDDATAKMWTLSDLEDAYVRRKGDAPPDPQSAACHSICDELLPMVDDARFAPERAATAVVRWLAGAAHDKRWGWV